MDYVMNPGRQFGQEGFFLRSEPRPEAYCPGYDNMKPL